jgi:hypothetical protein
MIASSGAETVNHSDDGRSDDRAAPNLSRFFVFPK